jgi:D-sedoheptulose 7-phosphate isomerase
MNNKIQIFKKYLDASVKTKISFFEACASLVIEAGELIKKTLLNGQKLLICGNGGSAADAQHFAAELVCRFEKEREAFSAIALTTDTSILTAWSNDYNFETVFARQIEALGNKGDVLIAISTSGNSSNIIRAVERAKEKEIYTIGLLGKDGGCLKEIVDLPIVVPSNRTAHIQECHLMVYHFWCEMIET